MTKLVRLLLEKIDRTDVVSNKGSTDKVEQGEVVEFILEDEDLRKLFWVLAQAGRNLERTVLNLRQFVLDCQDRGEDPTKNPKVSDFESEALKNHTIHSALHNLFWNSLRFEFPQLGGKSCGIREGWQIVSNSRRNQDFQNTIAIQIPRGFVDEIMKDIPQSPTGKKTDTFH